MTTSKNNEQGIGWRAATGEGSIGTGNWRWFPREDLPRVSEAAERWKAALAGVEKPWLCWCVDDDWNWWQQQLVVRVGWTPVVGTDGRVPRPRLVKDAVFIDFNEHLQYPVMWMHFPLDFVHLFCERLAFWHSDLLPPLDKMQRAARQFDAMPQGSIVAVDMTRVGLGQRIRRYLKGRQFNAKRYFELLGCTTAEASRANFECGCGWWKFFNYHVNFHAEAIGNPPHFDNGTGIWYWKKYFQGDVRKLAVNVHPYHYSTNRRDYQRARDERGKPISSKYAELNTSYDIQQIVAGLGREENDE